MATAPPPIKVQLFARPRLRLQTPTVGVTSLSSSSSSAWVVDVYVAAEQVLQNVYLKDPLNADQRSHCRWYLEQYVQKLPYSTDLANDAAHLLAAYPEGLLSQLRLQDVLARYLPQEAPMDLPQRVVSIEICDELIAGEDSQNTIHQIFWETLEGSTLPSNLGCSIIVHRGIQPLADPSLSLLHNVQSWKHADRAATTINILLVIGRDISEDSTTYNDISPSLVLNTLLEVQRQLEESDAAVQLHVEIVRPGTLTAFKAHLQRSKDIHGQGYFHIVHFDMHGRVGTDKKKSMTYGFLKFCRDNSDGTVLQPASRVGAIIKKYGIPYVILNACESGRANCGDDANIAKVFQKQGVRTILAMSFKISSSAVKLFLSTFYHGLLVDGSSFAASAAIARRTLRLKSKRPARFGLHRDLSDSFVPVVYGSAGESIFIAADHGEQRHVAKSPSPSIAEHDNDILPPVSRVLGRDFDVLRLEKVLLQSGLVCVHGLAGVGKSAFLRYAASTWKKTAFVDAVITVDFAERAIMSEQDFLNAVLGQLLQVSGQQFRALLWTLKSLSLQSHDKDTIKHMIAELLSTLKVAIILDNLDAPFSPFGSFLVPGKLDEIDAFEIWESIKSIFLPVKVPETDNGWYLICSTRRQNKEWLSSLTGSQPCALYFELRGLELSDAIELSQSIISADGENIDKWTYEDGDWLEAIIDLLQGIPLALLEILPAQRLLNIPLRLFHGRLHSGLVTSPADLNWLDSSTCSFLNEMRHLSAALSKHDFMILSLFGNYWHEAPPLPVLQRVFNLSIKDLTEHGSQEEYNSDEFLARAITLLAFAIDRGYLRVNLHGNEPYVHPLFTIYNRAVAFQTGKLIGGARMKELIVDSIYSLYFLSPESNKPPVGNSNVLTCINFCLLGQSVITVEQWPMQLFVSSIIRLCFFPTGAAPWVSEKYYQLLELFSGYFKVPISDELDGVFFSIIALSCISCPSRVIWTTEHLEKINQLGSNMLQMLGEYYGCELDPKAALSKGSLLIIKRLLLLISGREEEAESTWQALKCLKYKLLHHIGEGPYKEPSLSSTYEADGTLIMQDETSTIILGSGIGISYKVFGVIVDMLLENEEEVSAMRKSTVSKELKVSFRRDAQVTESFHQYVKGFNRNDLEEASRCSARNLQVTTIDKGDERVKALKLLEHASDNGDWIHMFEQHRSMFFNAMYGFLYDEAEEHLKALGRICENLSGVAPGTELAQLEEIVQNQKSLYMLSASVFPSAAGGRKDALEVAQKISLSIAEIAPEQFSLAEKSSAKVKEKERSGGYPTQVSRELFMKLTRKHGRKMQDPMWLVNLLGTLESYAKYITKANEAWNSDKLDSCVEYLDLIDELIEREEYLYDLISERPDTFKEIRYACQRKSAAHELLSKFRSAIAKGDHEAVRSYLEDIAAFKGYGDQNWMSAGDLATMRVVAEKGHLEQLMLHLTNAQSANNLQKSRAIYEDVVKRWEDGGFPSVGKDQMHLFKSENLEWMMDQAIEAKLWEQAIKFCSGYLKSLEVELREDPRAQDRILNKREQCEGALIQQSMSIAEAELDFERCIQLVDGWGALWDSQNQTRERRRSTFLIISQKLLDFLKGCYLDRCIPCARWARLQEQTTCTFDDRRRGQENRGRDTTARPATRRHHDRNALQAPFGCIHHCQGGYCFFD